MAHKYFIDETGLPDPPERKKRKSYPKYETCDLMHNGICVSKPCTCKGMAMKAAREKSKSAKLGKV